MLNHLTLFSGGQTGADRAALDFAIEYQLDHGGWCPKGRRAEDGPIPVRYQLRETPSWHYSQRTEWNIRDSDATVVFSIAPQLKGGSALTIHLAERLGQPCLHLARDGSDDDPVVQLTSFLTQNKVHCLNIAGPRASQEPESGPFVKDVLRAVLAGLAGECKQEF